MSVAIGCRLALGLVLAAVAATALVRLASILLDLLPAPVYYR